MQILMGTAGSIIWMEATLKENTSMEHHMEKEWKYQQMDLYSEESKASWNLTFFCSYVDGDSVYGTLTKRNGDVYEGCYINRKMHGLGRLTLANGEKIEGEFLQGYASGICRVTYPDGSCYEGEFKNGKKHGKGLYKFVNGNTEVRKYENDQLI